MLIPVRTKFPDGDIATYWSMPQPPTRGEVLRAHSGWNGYARFQVVWKCRDGEWLLFPLAEDGNE